MDLAEQLDKPKAKRKKKSVVKTALIKSRSTEASSKSYDPPEPKIAEDIGIGKMLRDLRDNPTTQIDATVLGVHHLENGVARVETRRIKDKSKFLRLYQECNSGKFKEADPFDSDSGQIGSSLIGKDFIPLLGGPFHKQLYLHDMLEQQALAFYAYHHDSIAFRAVHILRDFTLGKGWSTSADTDDESKKGLAVWQAFEKVNKLQNQFRFGSVELSLNGEIMWRWLKNNATSIAYKVGPGQTPQSGLLPRVRLFDPSMCWEIVTYPEDIQRVLYYQIVSPTQYQMYTGNDAGKSVPSMKYIFEQIPADEVQHYKINCVSNEKRGRSDLYPIFGDLKRLRDTTDYAIVAVQKSAAWAIDTTIKGNGDDIAAYQADVESQGQFAPAGSEFCHTDAITRNYLSNSATSKGGGGANTTFDMVFARIFIGMGIPEHYFGQQKTGGGTRGNAIIASEPVAKVFEMRQQLYVEILTDMKEKLFEKMGLDPNIEIEFTFPEIITQDRSAKLKDLALCEVQSWISNKTAAESAAKELGIDTYNYDDETAQILSEPQQFRAPLSPQTPAAQAPGAAGPAPSSGAQPAQAAKPLSSPGLFSQDKNNPTKFSGEDKNKVKDMNRGV